MPLPPIWVTELEPAHAYTIFVMKVVPPEK